MDVEALRADTPGCARGIHFNGCGAALQPRPVLDAVQEHLRLEGELGGYEAADARRELVESTHDAVARLLGCHRDEVAIVENATRGWDMAFYGIPLRAGDRILTSRAEYASNYIAFLQVAKKTAAVIEPVPNDSDGQLDVAALEDMMDDRVALIAVTHVPTNGGLVNPAEEIGRVARRHGVPYLLDACQSAGQLALDTTALGCDFLSATSRKYLRGPRGVGFLHVRREWIERIEPPFLDLHSAEWTASGAYAVRRDARRFENWECNVAARIGLGVAIRYALDLGLPAIERRIVHLAKLLRERLAAVPRVTVRDVGARRSGIVSFTHERHDAETLTRALADRGITVTVSTVLGTRLDMEERGIDAVVRAGVHYYNTEDEIGQLADALTEIDRSAT